MNTTQEQVKDEYAGIADIIERADRVAVKTSPDREAVQLMLKQAYLRGQQDAMKWFRSEVMT